MPCVQLVQVIVAGLHEHRHPQLGPMQRVHHAQLVPEVRERHDDAADLVAMLAEKVGALAGVRQGFDRAARGLSGGQDDSPMPEGLELAEQLLATVARQFGRETAAGSDDDSEGEFVLFHGDDEVGDRLV